MSEVNCVSDCGLDGLTFSLPSRCKPQYAADCDLGTIVKRFLRTGELPAMVNRPTIDDASDAPTDIFAAIDPAVAVRQRFDQLPLEERNKYNNDPESWIVDQLQKSATPAPSDPSAPSSETVDSSAPSSETVDSSAPSSETVDS